MAATDIVTPPSPAFSTPHLSPSTSPQAMLSKFRPPVLIPRSLPTPLAGRRPLPPHHWQPPVMPGVGHPHIPKAPATNAPLPPQQQQPLTQATVRPTANMTSHVQPFRGLQPPAPLHPHASPQLAATVVPVNPPHGLGTTPPVALGTTPPIQSVPASRLPPALSDIPPTVPLPPTVMSPEKPASDEGTPSATVSPAKPKPTLQPTSNSTIDASTPSTPNTPIGGNRSSDECLASGEASPDASIRVVPENCVYTRAHLNALRLSSNRFCPPKLAEFLLQEVYKETTGKALTKVPQHLILLTQPPAPTYPTERNAAFGANVVASRLRQVKEIHQKVMSVLSRVTPNKYEPLKQELLELPLRQTTDEQLRQVVNVFFEKAVKEQKFSTLYARLVSDICQVSPTDHAMEKDQREKLIAYRMRRELLNRCQEEFVRPFQLQSNDLKGEDGQPLAEDVIEEKRQKVKERLCGNIKFVAELYKRKLVTDRVIDEVLNQLSSRDHPEDYVLEVFVTLMTTAGQRFSVALPERTRHYMDVAQKFQMEPSTSTRLRFLLMDLKDCEAHGWQEKNKLLTSEELELKAFDEQRKQQEDIDRHISESSMPSSPFVQTPVNGANSPSRVGRAAPQFPPPTGNSPHLPPRSAQATPTQAAPAPIHSVPSSPSLVANTPRAQTRVTKTPELSRQRNMTTSPTTPPTPSTAETSSDRQMDAMFEQLESSNEFASVAAAISAMPTLAQRHAALSRCLRRAVATTRHFCAREQAPMVFLAVLQRESELCQQSNTTHVPLTLGDLQDVILHFLTNLVETREFVDCPRLFSNWAALVLGATRQEVEHRQKGDTASAEQLGALFNVGMHTRMLLEVVASTGDEHVAPLTKGVWCVSEATREILAQSIPQGAEAAAAAITKDMNVRLPVVLQRFRFLPCLLLAVLDEFNRDASEPRGGASRPATNGTKALENLLQRVAAQAAVAIQNAGRTPGLGDLEISLFQAIHDGASESDLHDRVMGATKGVPFIAQVHVAMCVVSAYITTAAIRIANAMKHTKSTQKPQPRAEATDPATLRIIGSACGILIDVRNAALVRNEPQRSALPDSSAAALVFDVAVVLEVLLTVQYSACLASDPKPFISLISAVHEQLLATRVVRHRTDMIASVIQVHASDWGAHFTSDDDVRSNASGSIPVCDSADLPELLNVNRGIGVRSLEDALSGAPNGNSTPTTAVTEDLLSP